MAKKIDETVLAEKEAADEAERQAARDKLLQETTVQVQSLRKIIDTTLEERKYCCPHLIQVLGWMEFFENQHPGLGTWFPVWLTKIYAWHDAINEGYIEQRTTIVSIRDNKSTPVYGLTAKGRKIIEDFTKANS